MKQRGRKIQVKRTGYISKKIRLSALVSFCWPIFVWASASAEPARHLSAADRQAEQVQEEKSIEAATESFKSILEEAKLKGFVSDKNSNTDASGSNPLDSSETSARLRQNLEAAMKPSGEMTEYSCVDADVLDFKPLVANNSIDDLVLTKSTGGGRLDSTEVQKLARTYISLGLGAEAQALLRPYKDPRHELLSRAGALISGHRPLGDAPIFAAIAYCSAAADMWASIETPARLEYSTFLSSPQTLIKEILVNPPLLKTNLGLELAIGAAEAGNLLLATSLWKEMAKYDLDFEDGLKGDHAQLYLTALRTLAREPDKAIQILSYLGERDGLYRAKALKALAGIKYASGDSFGAAMESDLESVRHERAGEKVGREAAVQLIKNRLQDGLAIDAIRTTKKMLQPDDTEFVYVVDLIANHVEALLMSPTSTVKMLGLNTYLEDQSFFKGSDRQSALQRAALLAAITLDLPELGEIIYSHQQPTREEDIAYLAYANTLGALKRGEVPDGSKLSAAAGSEQDYADNLRQAVIKTALRLGDFNTARATIATLPKGEDKTLLETQTAWLEGAWAKAQKSMTPKSGSIPQESEGGSVSLYQNRDVVDLLLASKPSAKKASALKTKSDVSTFMSDIETDLSTVQEYLDNG